MTYYLNLSLLSNNYNNQQKRLERRKLLSAEARRILSLCEGRPITEDDIAREASGRPFFQGSDADFSISHSGALTAVSLVRGKNLRTGCDVELVRPRARAREIAQEFFTTQERKYIDADSSPNGTRFYQIWTLKECYLKLKGLSVFDMASVPSFANSEGSLLNTHLEQISFNLYEFIAASGERYIATTALEGGEFHPKIRWFSKD
ncbi:hypothetical protein R84B8_01669 [Treponema sp. R8-4-B8]